MPCCPAPHLGNMQQPLLQPFQELKHNFTYNVQQNASKSHLNLWQGFEGTFAKYLTALLAY